MGTDEAWELLNSRDEWQARCRVIAQHRREHPDWGAEALQAYALGEVIKTLEADNDWFRAADLQDSAFSIDWPGLFERFQVTS